MPGGQPGQGLPPLRPFFLDVSVECYIIVQVKKQNNILILIKKSCDLYIKKTKNVPLWQGDCLPASSASPRDSNFHGQRSVQI
jgi:hypothetical protein